MNRVIDEFTREEYELLYSAFKSYRVYMNDAEEVIAEQILDKVFYPSFDAQERTEDLKASQEFREENTDWQPDDTFDDTFDEIVKDAEESTLLMNQALNHLILGVNYEKGLNIDVTSGQYQFLYDLVMMAYELDIPEQKGWDMQTYDNLVDNVCNAKETYLREDTKGL